MPKAPKFFIMYKRAGFRVIINHNGDMIVRPSAVEASVQVAGAPCISVRACWRMSHVALLLLLCIVAYNLEAESSAALQITHKEGTATWPSCLCTTLIVALHAPCVPFMALIFFL